VAFENVKIRTTRNGVTPVVGYRQDLAIGDVVAATLTSTIGVGTFHWQLIGRPEGSTAGGAGPEPIELGNGSTSSFTVDDDTLYKRDGTYDLQCTLNEGAPTEARVLVGLARLSDLTTADGRVLRKLGGFETADIDTADPLVRQGWAKMFNRWLEKLRSSAFPGYGTTTQPDGAMNPGVSPLVSRADHVHVGSGGSGGSGDAGWVPRVRNMAQAKTGIPTDRMSFLWWDFEGGGFDPDAWDTWGGGPGASPTTAFTGGVVHIRGKSFKTKSTVSRGGANAKWFVYIMLQSPGPGPQDFFGGGWVLPDLSKAVLLGNAGPAFVSSSANWKLYGTSGGTIVDSGIVTGGGWTELYAWQDGSNTGIQVGSNAPVTVPSTNPMEGVTFVSAVIATSAADSAPPQTIDVDRFAVAFDNAAFG
jgi:hypothetical protein